MFLIAAVSCFSNISFSYAATTFETEVNGNAAEEESLNPLDMEEPEPSAQQQCIDALNFQQDFCLSTQEMSAIIRCGPIRDERDRLGRIRDDVCRRDPNSTACEIAERALRGAELAGQACIDQINKEKDACLQNAAKAYDACIRCVINTGKVCPVPIWIDIPV